MYDVYVAQLCCTIYAVRSNGRVIAKVPSGTDCSRLLKAAVDAVPNASLLVILVFTLLVNLMQKPLHVKYPLLVGAIVPQTLLPSAAPLLRVDALGLVKRVI